MFIYTLGDIINVILLCIGLLGVVFFGGIAVVDHLRRKWRSKK